MIDKWIAGADASSCWLEHAVRPGLFIACLADQQVGVLRFLEGDRLEMITLPSKHRDDFEVLNTNEAASWFGVDLGEVDLKLDWTSFRSTRRPVPGALTLKDRSINAEALEPRDPRGFRQTKRVGHIEVPLPSGLVLSCLSWRLERAGGDESDPQVLYRFRASAAAPPSAEIV